MENITKKIILEKDKVTTIVQKEPAEGESTSSKIIQTADKIIIEIPSTQEIISKVLKSKGEIEMDLTNEIEKVANEIIDLADRKNMSIKNISWLLTQIEKTIYEKAKIAKITN